MTKTRYTFARSRYIAFLSSSMAPSPAKRNTQIVIYKSRRLKVSRWMKAKVSASGTHKTIAKKAVNQFPLIFTLPNRKAALQKARQWYESAEFFFNELKAPQIVFLSILNSKTGGPAVRRVGIEPLTGRGRKRPFWKEKLYEWLLEEFK